MWLCAYTDFCFSSVSCSLPGLCPDCFLGEGDVFRLVGVLPWFGPLAAEIGGFWILLLA